MNLTEKLPTLHAQPRTQKWRLIQFMVADLASEEETSPIEGGGAYPITSPYHASDATNALLKALGEEACE